MKFFLLHLLIVVYSYIEVTQDHVKAELDLKTNPEEKSFHCQDIFKQLEELEVDNKDLLARLEQRQSIFPKLLQLNNEIEKEFVDFEESLVELQVQLMDQQQKHFKHVKDVINLKKSSIDFNKQNLRQSLEQIFKLQKIITSKLSNNIEDDALEDDNEQFCWNFYTKTLSEIDSNLIVLEKLNTTLETGTKKFINELRNHENDIENPLQFITTYLDQKDFITDKPEVCVRTKDKELMCTEESLPTSCVQYDSRHCANDKCRIRNLLYGPETFLVPCDDNTEGGGWTIIQRRINGSVDFNRGWSEYRDGFGNLDGEFWLGLEKIHALTTTLFPVELLIQMKDHNDTSRYAKYDTFAIGSADDLYELRALKDYKGNAGDSLGSHKGRKFSTWDTNYDTYDCAAFYKGGWWYHKCYRSNLNGFYYETGQAPENKRGVGWNTLHGRDYSLKSVQMMIRPWRL